MAQRADWLHSLTVQIQEKNPRFVSSGHQRLSFFNIMLVLPPSWDVLTVSIIVRNGKHQVTLHCGAGNDSQPSHTALIFEIYILSFPSEGPGLRFVLFGINFELVLFHVWFSSEQSTKCQSSGMFCQMWGWDNVWFCCFGAVSVPGESKQGWALTLSEDVLQIGILEFSCHAENTAGPPALRFLASESRGFGSTSWSCFWVEVMLQLSPQLLKWKFAQCILVYCQWDSSQLRNGDYPLKKAV